MNCPNDGTVLLMSERSGVEIDYCPSCRGVWLDRGELDRIIERFEGPTGRAEPEPRRAGGDRDDDRERERRERERREHEHRYVEHRYGDRPKKKKKGLLSELFEFE
jgi:uncharacterized protein